VQTENYQGASLNAELDGKRLVPPKIFRYRYERSGPPISVLTLRENADSVDCGVINGPIDMGKDWGGGDMQDARAWWETSTWWDLS
jgi:hypothetical protein